MSVKSVLPASIETIAVIDDDPRARDSLAESVIDAKLKPIIENGHISNLLEYIQKLKARAQAAICDHRLTPGNYASFEGAEAVANLYLEKFPAILITQWCSADIDSIRRYRRKIPVMIKSDELEAEAITMGLAQCINEFNGIFNKDRRPWRTLIRIENVDNNYSHIIIPAWDPNHMIRIPLTVFPNVSMCHPGQRFFAEVNLGSPNSDNIYIDNF